MSLWVSFSAVAALGGLGVTPVVWLVRSELREYRRRRTAKRFLEACREQPRALPAELSPKVTVAELVARVESEGLPVRLRWEAGDRTARPKEWPTGVLPRVEE